MGLNSRNNIMIGALIVLLVFLLVMINDRYGLENFHPAAMAKNVDLPNPILDKLRRIGMINDRYGLENIHPAHPNPIMDNLRRNGMIVLPDKKAMESLSETALFQTYHSYLDNTDIPCKRKLRMGKVGDGGWEVCDDEKYRPSHNCLVYSFGINNDFSFDDDVSRVYNCSVISFDPSMKKESYQRSPLVYFLKMGISGKDVENPKKWQLRTLGSFLKKFKHTNRVIDVLKMDVESSEWSALPEMVSSETLRQVKQLLVEYHGRKTAKTALLSQLGVFKDIYDLGFRKFYVHKNFHCGFKSELYPVPRTSCYEVHYVNVNLV